MLYGECARGIIVAGVKHPSHEIVGVPDHRIGETLDVIFRAVRQMIKPELVLDSSRERGE